MSGDAMQKLIGEIRKQDPVLADLAARLAEAAAANARAILEAEKRVHMEAVDRIDRALNPPTKARATARRRGQKGGGRKGGGHTNGLKAAVVDVLTVNMQCDLDGIMERLPACGVDTANAKDVRKRLSIMLAQNKKIFERVGPSTYALTRKGRE